MIQKFFSNREKGKFIPLLIATFFALIGDVLYAVFYGAGNGTMKLMSWPAFVAFLLGVAAAVLFIALRRDVLASITLSIGSLVGFMLYIYGMYTYISAAFTGIDSTWEASFFVCTFSFLIALILGILSFCLNYKAAYRTQKALVSTFSVLLAIICLGNVIAGENSAAINSALKIDTFETIGDNDGDSEYYKSKYKNLKELKAAGEAKVEEAMAEGAVLLKNNEKALPLNQNAKVSLFGVASVDPVYGGTGSGSVEVSSAPTWKSAMEKAGFTINPTLWDFYSTGAGHNYLRKTGSTGAGVVGIKVIGEAPWSEINSACGSSVAAYGDAAIVTLARIGGEGADMPRGEKSISKMDDVTGALGDTTEGDYLKLSPKEKEMLAGVKALKDSGAVKKIIVVLNTTNQIEAKFLDDAEYDIDAALWIGTTGTTGLNAVAKILSGEISPSGSLSATFWKQHDKNPSLANFGTYAYDGAKNVVNSDGSLQQDSYYVYYQEGVYVGYRYTETRYEDFVMNTANVGSYRYADVVSYPFGHGLSYTTFDYSDYQVEKIGEGADAKYTVSVKVTNSGDVAGKEPVQIYLQKPYGNYNKQNQVEAPAVELVGFAKTKTLNPGESQIVKVTVDERQFASYDANGAKTYVLTGGDYYLTAATDAHHAVNNILAKKNYTVENTSARMDGNGNTELVSDAITLGIDTTTFSTSEATGATITNAFAFADYNQYANKQSTVNYLTRSDWESTMPKSLDDHVILKWNQQLTDDMNYYGKQGETKLPEVKGDYPAYSTYQKDEKGNEVKLQLIDLRVDQDGNEIAYNDPKWEQLLDQLSWNECVELVRYGMRRTGLIESIGKPETLDHNGPSGLTENYVASKVGLANQTKDPDRASHAVCYPSGGILAASMNIDLLYEIGDLIGEDGLWAGYAGLYGPGSNIQRTPYSGRNFEYYSEDGYLSGRICAYECAGIESHGIYVYNKHIGLNDQEDLRRGVCTWANEQAIREVYMKAFELPITIEGTEYHHNEETITLKGASGVMTAFNRMGLYWSSLNKGLMTTFLREECGMKGIAVTDMWYGTASTYMNLPQMLVAGCNLIDGQQEASQLDASKTNHADVAWGMRESVHRILYTVVHSRAMNGISANTVIKQLTPWWQTLLNGLEIGFGVIVLASVAWIIVTEVKKKRK